MACHYPEATSRAFYVTLYACWPVRVSGKFADYFEHSENILD